jgi:hypothetical protein
VRSYLSDLPYHFRKIRAEKARGAVRQMPDRALAIVLNAVLTSVPRVVTATTQITAIKPTSIPYSTKAAPSSSWRNRLITLPTGEIHSYLRQISRVDRLAQQAVLLTKLARRTLVSKKFRTPVRQPLLCLNLTQSGGVWGCCARGIGVVMRRRFGPDQLDAE